MLSALSCGAHGQEQSSPCEQWKAWVSHHAAGPVILHVTAECQLPTPGHKVELVPDANQGSDSTVLVLKEIVHSPSSLVAQVITPYKLHYKKKMRKAYKEVLIQPSGTPVKIEAATKGSSQASPAK